MAIKSDIKFPEPTEAAWRLAVDRALKGAPFDEVMKSQTADGLIVDALYEGVQDVSPINRPHGASPWTVVQKMDHPDPKSANEQAHEDLMNGATGLALVFSRSHAARGYGLDVSPETFDIALEGIDLSAIHLRLEAGIDGFKAHSLFADYVKRSNIDPSPLNMRFGLDPIGALAAGGTMPWSLDEVTQHISKEWQERAEQGFKGPFVEADGRPYHDAGATQADELAIILAKGLFYLRTLEAASEDAQKACDAIGFTLSAECDQFLTIAKFRAMRLLWNRVQDACGLTPKPAALHAETSFRMMSKGDPNSNMLRLSLASFAASVGGADSLAVLPFTAALGLSDDFARRMARNTQSILLEESNLYRVIDPAAGSGAFETLSDNLAREAWAKFQDIEKQGGIVEALIRGHIHSWIEAANTMRAAAFQSGDKTLVGASLHPHDGSGDASVLDIKKRAPTERLKAALDIKKLSPLSDEELLRGTS